MEILVRSDHRLHRPFSCETRERFLFPLPYLFQWSRNSFHSLVLWVGKPSDQVPRDPDPQSRQRLPLSGDSEKATSRGRSKAAFEPKNHDCDPCRSLPGGERLKEKFRNTGEFRFAPDFADLRQARCSLRLGLEHVSEGASKDAWKSYYEEIVCQCIILQSETWSILEDVLEGGAGCLTIRCDKRWCAVACSGLRMGSSARSLTVPRQSDWRHKGRWSGRQELSKRKRHQDKRCYVAKTQLSAGNNPRQDGRSARPVNFIAVSLVRAHGWYRWPGL